MKSTPIGIFDSGVGGVSIFREIHTLLPLEHIIYLADSINAPYGNKPKEEIIRLCEKNTEELLSRGCKIIVVACNTATTNAIVELREKYDVPFIGIEPAIKPAALKTNTRKIGILATHGTLSSALFAKTSELFAKDIDIVEVVGEGLVEAIENGGKDSEETYRQLQMLLKPLLDQKIDYLVLGCSHYPFLIPQIKKILPEGLNIIDSGQAVAKQTKTVLKNLDLLTKEQQQTPEFYTNVDPEVLQNLLSSLSDENFKVSHLRF